MFRILLHYALLLFALLMSILSLGACWGPNVMRGAAILTPASQLVKQPRRGQGSRAVARNTALLERKVRYAAGISASGVFLIGS